MEANGTIDDLYFEWLYGQIAAVTNRNPARSYWSLARQLYTTEFAWFIPNDDNRAEDGKELRNEFIDLTKANVTQDWMDLNCSMLEMLIALARRASFETGLEPLWWFWKLMDNIELKNYTDITYNVAVTQDVQEKLERVCQRTYRKNGRGGLFPLSHTIKDQTEVELWYQMAAYLLEEQYVDIA
jgi:hypothetical protein